MASAPITIEEARRSVLSHVHGLGSERIPIDAALGRVLAGAVTAGGDVPPFACSAMDGYAVKAGTSGRALRVVGEARAGSPTTRTLGDGEAIRISTGAAVPEGAEGVIRQEDARQLEGEILTDAPTRPGENIRAAGEDMRAGAVVLEAGTVLGAAELGAAVGAGAGAVSVARAPRVAVLCTGDELRAPGEPLGPGEIHNSNEAMLRSLAQRTGALATTGERLPDDFEITRAALESHLGRADAVVISGGVSVGPHDHVKPALASLGVQEVFWRVSLQPGRPTWFGVRDKTLVFGLPGNPVSVVVTFCLFVRPALLAMQGALPRAQPLSEVALGAAVARNPRREQALRVRLERRDGALVATPNGAQASHLLSSLIGAHALAFIPPGEGQLPAGTMVAIEELPH